MTTSPKLVRSPAQRRLLDVLRAAVDARAAEAVGPFSARLLTLPDRAMRAAVLIERLGRCDAHLCLALLDGLIDGANRRRPGAGELLLDITTARPLAGALGYEHARAVYELARARERRSVSRLFLSPESLAGAVPGEAFLSRQNQKMADTPLGWRKAHARGSDRHQLDRLLFDRNPAVIVLLLQNPRITEPDVVRIAAMQPTNPENLLAVFRSVKWLKRYRVKVALACNPYTPVDVALACLPHLMVQRLRFVAARAKLKVPVREMARDLLARRAQRPAADEEPQVHRLTEAGEIILEPPDEGEAIDLEAAARELDAFWAGPEGRDRR